MCDQLTFMMAAHYVEVMPVAKSGKGEEGAGQAFSFLQGNLLQCHDKTRIQQGQGIPRLLAMCNETERLRRNVTSFQHMCIFF